MLGFIALVSRLISQSECIGFLTKFAIEQRSFLLDCVYSLQLYVFIESEFCQATKGHHLFSSEVFFSLYQIHYHPKTISTCTFVFPICLPIFIQGDIFKMI